MKSRRVQFLAIIATLIAVGAVLSFAARSGRGQSQSKKTESPVKPTILMTERKTAAGSKASSPFDSAAAQNAMLRNDLSWTFGGKQQHGWHLYDSLIRQTLDNTSESTTADFA